MEQNIRAQAAALQQDASQRVQEKVVQGVPDLKELAPQASQQEALRRLQVLQERMVGGEKKNDQKLKEKRKERKAYATSRWNDKPRQNSPPPPPSYMYAFTPKYILSTF